MAIFQPGLSFVSDYMTKLSPGRDSNLCAGDSTITTNKMARRKLLLLKTKAWATSSTKFSAFWDGFGPSND